MSCSDSRVPLSIVFDRGIGDLFVVRDAGNIATPEEIGSLEYGAFVLVVYKPELYKFLIKYTEVNQVNPEPCII